MARRTLSPESTGGEPRCPTFSPQSTPSQPGGQESSASGGPQVAAGRASRAHRRTVCRLSLITAPLASSRWVDGDPRSIFCRSRKRFSPVTFSAESGGMICDGNKNISLFGSRRSPALWILVGNSWKSARRTARQRLNDNDKIKSLFPATTWGRGATANDNDQRQEERLTATTFPVTYQMSRRGSLR